jgi:uncharacterized Ntn-hydrolase superfamily protein
VMPVHTYSIVARDPTTGELGVAVQSHYFSVGSVVPWAEAGVGVVATQSFLNLAYGPEGLELMRSGRSAPEALAELLQRDPEQDLRQVALVDAFGSSAAHTGERCIAAAGHFIGDGYSVQANIMVDHGVWPAMARAYETASGDLAERLVVALEAAQAAGGDLRGQQSAALWVVTGDPPERPGEGKRFDLRVEDHPTPLAELRRLLHLARAYRYVEEADAATGQGRYEEAAAAYQMAMRLAPEIAELKAWAAIAMVQMGQEREAMPLFETAFRADPKLVELLPRVAALGLVQADPALLDQIATLVPERGAPS